MNLSDALLNVAFRCIRYIQVSYDTLATRGPPGLSMSFVLSTYCYIIHTYGTADIETVLTHLLPVCDRYKQVIMGGSRQP